MMKKEISIREIILLGVLIILAAYYLMVQGPVARQTKELEAKSQELQMQVDVLTPKVNQKKAWERELEQIYAEADGEPVGIPDYDNISEINMEFSMIFDERDKYPCNITFSKSNYLENIICRDIRISFTAPSYEAALEKINALKNSKNKYLIGNVNISNDASRSTVNLNLTEFEYVSD